MVPMSANDHGSDIHAGVRRYCRERSYDTSTTEAAIQWALRSPGSTLLAIAAGRNRADQLHARMKRNQPELRA